MKIRNESKILNVDSIGPLQFCLKVKQDLGHELEPDIVQHPKIEMVQRWLFINQGWRLTHRGFGLLSKHYRVYGSQNKDNEILTGRVLINMDHCVAGPWFARGQQIFVFDQMAHFELEMVDGKIGRAHV